MKGESYKSIILCVYVWCVCVWKNNGEMTGKACKHVCINKYIIYSYSKYMKYIVPKI